MSDTKDPVKGNSANSSTEGIDLKRNTYTVGNYANIIQQAENMEAGYARFYYNRPENSQEGNISLQHKSYGGGGDERYAEAGDTKVDYRSRYSHAPINFYRESKILESDDNKNVAEKEVEYAGGMYFKHGYDGYGEGKTLNPEGFQSVDLAQVAKTLIENENFSLELSAHADRSGDAEKNQTLSENRLNWAQTEIINALKAEGLGEKEAETLYNERVIRNKTSVSIAAHGEESGPLKTDDDVRAQANRVVAFSFTKYETPEALKDALSLRSAHKENHTHITIGRVYDNGVSVKINNGGHQKLADEGSSYDMAIGVEQKLEFMKDKSEIECQRHAHKINYVTKNIDADNCDFRVLTDKPVTAVYDQSSRHNHVAVMVEGKTFARIYIEDHIDPSRIRVGSIDIDGHVKISPVTDPEGNVLETRFGNRLTNAIEELVDLSLTAKNTFGNTASHEEYIEKISDTDFEKQLSETVKQLGDLLDVDLSEYESNLKKQYLENDNPNMFHPDLVLDPDQIAHQIVSDYGFASEDFGGDYLAKLTERFDMVKEMEAHTPDASKSLVIDSTMKL